MSETKHTPGPWKAYNAINGRTLKHWRIKGDCVRNDPPFAVIDSGGKLLPEYEAGNARLIAAAPDLLEACKQLVWKLSHDHSPSGKGDDCRPGTIDRRDVVYHNIRAAIAKATGN